jgi:hypothetical protein
MQHRIKARLTAVLAAGALTLTVAACGGGGSGRDVATVNGPSGNARASGDGTGNHGGSQDPQEGMLAFAKCMREHGIDMPDPKMGANGTAQFQVPGDPTDPKFKAAQSACQQQTGGGIFGGNGPSAADPKVQDAMLRFARCMRQHGVPKFPDPSAQGLLLGPDSSVDPTSPAFKAAQKACQPIMAGVLGSPSGAGDGS